MQDLFSRVFDDANLAIMIAEFAPTHRELFRDSLEDLKLQSIKFILTNKISKAKNLLKKYDISPEECIRRFSTCSCCYRHQTNRPFTLAPWTDTPMREVDIETPCKCPCRHISRHMCGLYCGFN